MRNVKVLFVGSALMLVLAACSSDNGGDQAASGDASSPSPAEQASNGAEVQAADSSLGTILTDSDGKTLYVFLSDSGPESTCYQDCASNWPALTTDGDPAAGQGVDASLLGTTERTDGSVQVTYADHPLYHFGGDQAPGDTNGQEIGDVWYVVSPEGEPVEGAGESGGGDESSGGQSGGRHTEVEAEDSAFGTILTDSNGNTLYMFLNDTGPESTCYEDCAANWPAFEAKGELGAGDGVDASLLGTTERTDGTTQVTYADHPLYHFGGDQAPGDTNGQEIGDVWYVVSPEGEPVEG
jgi:predicted lipoprotein with Yx(FWY)xxD motif